MSHAVKGGDATRLATLRAAYRLADEARQDVVIIWERKKYEYTDRVPCFCLASEATSEELASGQVIRWRETV